MRIRKIHQSTTTTTCRCLLLSLLLIAVSSVHVVLAQQEGTSSSNFTPIGYQTGPDPIRGSFSFAVSGTYRPRPDKTNNNEVDGNSNNVGELVVVGTTTQGDVFRMNPDDYYDEETGQKVEIDAPSCFIGTVPLSGGASPADNDLSFEHHVTIEIPSTLQECHRATLLGTNRLLVLGHATGGGQQSILSPLYVEGGYVNNANVGLMMDLSLDTVNVPSWALRGGNVLQQSSRSYPVAASIVHGGGAAGTGSDTTTSLYVASMETDWSVDGWPTYQTIDFLHDPLEFFLYGNLYLDLVVTQTRVATSNDQENQQHDDEEELRQTFEETWRVKFATAGGESVYTAGIETLDNGQLLGIAGTTAGYGKAFGATSSNENEDDPEGNDIDGFVSLLSPTTGHLLYDDPPSAMRITSIDGQDDWVAGTCSSPREPNAIYVVGSTMGRMSEAVPSDGKHPESIHAFLLKLHVVDEDEGYAADGTTTTIKRLKIVWGRQLGANDGEDASVTTKVRGVTCTVTPDAKQVYYGGVVHDGAVLDLAGTTVSYGKDDIFVERVVAETGESQWIRQFGSSADDSIAPRDGLVVPDNNDNNDDASSGGGENNVIVIGSTYGSMYRVRDDGEEGKDDNADVFVTTISGIDGEIAIPVLHPPEVPSPATPKNENEGGAADGAGADNASKPNPPPSDDKNQSPPKPSQPKKKPSKTKTTTPDHEEETAATTDGNLPAPARFGIVSVFLIAGGIIAAVYCCFYGPCARKKLFCCKSEETERGRVLGYLNEFEVEDVDMRHSATGGWHCSYTGPLAHGVNHKEQQKTNISSTPTKSSLSSANTGLTTPLTGTTNILEDDLYTSAFIVTDTETILRRETQDGDGYDNDAERGGLDNNTTTSISSSSTTNCNSDISYNAYRNARWAQEEDEEERASVSGLLLSSDESRRNRGGSSSLRATLAKRRSQERPWGRGVV